MNERKHILSKHLEIDTDEAESLLDSDDYLVLDDKEANERCEESIRQGVWSFNASFLSYHTNLSESVLKKIQESCEDCNDDMIELIKDFDDFVDDAVASDGRGHFISSYDGEEHEFKYRNKWYYIYRIN